RIAIDLYDAHVAWIAPALHVGIDEPAELEADLRTTLEYQHPTPDNTAGAALGDMAALDLQIASRRRRRVLAANVDHARAEVLGDQVKALCVDCFKLT